MGTFAKIFFDQFKSVSQYYGGENPGAPWMWILAIIGFFAMAFIIERIILLNRVKIDQANYLDPLLDSLKKKDLDKAISLSDKFSKAGSPFADIVYRGLSAEAINPRYTYKDAIHEAKLEIYPKLQKRLRYISLFHGVATLIGLAGTIFGLILAFDAVGGKNSSESAQMLAAGISAAMGTTIGGLLIAIPTMACGAIVNRQIAKIIDKMDYYTNYSIKNLLKEIKINN